MNKQAEIDALFAEFIKTRPKTTTPAHFRQECWENDYQAKHRFDLAKAKYLDGVEHDTIEWKYQPIR